MSVTPKFTQKIKDKWLEALRSGNYVQGRGQLVDYNGSDVVKHCCLGVLCEIHPELEMIGVDDVNIKGQNNDKGYGIFINMLNIDRKTMCLITNTNDANCDGKYTAVIPLIEQLEVNEDI